LTVPNQADPHAISLMVKRCGICPDQIFDAPLALDRADPVQHENFAGLRLRRNLAGCNVRDDFTMKPMWVTGATGFLGGRVVADLLRTGYDVVASGRQVGAMVKLDTMGAKHRGGRIRAERENRVCIAIFPVTASRQRPGSRLISASVYS